MAANGLFRCRNTELFTSCVPVASGPQSLARREPFLRIRSPHVPRRLLESIVGFFSVVYDCYRAEAAVLILWNRFRQRYQILVPEQTSRVFVTWQGTACPLSVDYETPASLPPDTCIVGDVHSHGNGPAFTSWTDRDDEIHRAGFHIVVGQIDQDPPQFHVEAVVDGTRFRVPTDSLLEGYRHRRRRVPARWLERVHVDTEIGSFSSAHSEPTKDRADSPTCDTSAEDPRQTRGPEDDRAV